ncbi:MAG: hypothetical protein OXF30_03300 [Candidatus Saccharibacteria bacterium]|nr:hypothetical protein [Candidatus Saccharibacteria bacterium]
MEKFKFDHQSQLPHQENPRDSFEDLDEADISFLMNLVMLQEFENFDQNKIVSTKVLDYQEN